jgi:AcrR family transcriptional regulator
MPKAFSEHEKEIISQHLLEQGYRLFSVYGLKKTNVDEIAHAAGISKGAFYSFYESKEELFLEVIEQAEKRVREQLLATIDLPGPSPRARLFAVLQKAFHLFTEIPMLQFFTGRDYDLLFRRIPVEQLQEHLVNDLAFIEELITRLKGAGIPVRAQTTEITALLYPLVLSILHQEELGRFNFPHGIDMHLELVAAFWLGEVELRFQQPSGTTPIQGKESLI